MLLGIRISALSSYTYCWEPPFHSGLVGHSPATLEKRVPINHKNGGSPGCTIIRPPNRHSWNRFRVEARVRVESHSAEEMPHFGQEIFVLAQATDGRASPMYRAMAEELSRLAGSDGIDRLLREHRCIALVAPTTGSAYPIRLVGGDQFEGSCATLPAASRYPHLTVPMGSADGWPVGISFIGPSRSEAILLSLGAGFDSTATRWRSSDEEMRCFLRSACSLKMIFGKFVMFPCIVLLLG